MVSWPGSLSHVGNGLHAGFCGGVWSFREVLRLALLMRRKLLSTQLPGALPGLT